MNNELRERLGFSPATVTDAQNGERLDRTLALCMPNTGLRQRRRVWESCEVLVDGVARAMSYRVRVGQALDVRQLPGADSGAEPGDRPQGTEVRQGRLSGNPAHADALVALVRVVATGTHYAALFKPGGLHSASLAGKPGVSVEESLPDLFPGRGATLLNRLDRPTSGLLLAGFSDNAALAFRAYEGAGQVDKQYLAVVRGAPDHMYLDARLDTRNRKKTRVLVEPDPDRVRHTRVTPLGPGPFPGTTLVRVLIRKGARHQIRAHLAHAGFPLVGDALYGAGEQPAAPRLYLHHSRISFAEFEAECGPDWE